MTPFYYARAWSNTTKMSHNSPFRHRADIRDSFVSARHTRKLLYRRLGWALLRAVTWKYFHMQKAPPHAHSPDRIQYEIDTTLIAYTYQMPSPRTLHRHTASLPTISSSPRILKCKGVVMLHTSIRRHWRRMSVSKRIFAAEFSRGNAPFWSEPTPLVSIIEWRW